MILGPIQFVLVSLPNENLTGRIAKELRAASDSGSIRVLDALAIQKQQDGSVASISASDLTLDQRMEYGAIVGALLGYGAEGEEGAEVGAEMGALAFADHNFGLTQDDIQNIAQGIPAGTTGVVVLFEHRWAIPLKEAVQDAGGLVVAQGMVRPETLIGLGAALAAADTPDAQMDTTQNTQQLH